MINFKQYSQVVLIGEYIVQRKNKYYVHSKTGKVLGQHPTKAKALKQLAAIEINKE